mgnify:CR=1 FL=1
MAARGARGGGGGHRQVVGQGIDHRLVPAPKGSGQGGAVFGIDHLGADAGASQAGQGGGVLVHHRHLVVARGGQQAGNGLADVADGLGGSYDRERALIILYEAE